jgi:hypothetical protein
MPAIASHTALVLAFLQVTQLMPVVEIAARRADAAHHFGDLTSPFGWSFDDQCSKFLTFLSPGILNTRQRWWLRVRATAVSVCASLLTLTLACRVLPGAAVEADSSPEHGSWDVSSTTALALQARTVGEVAQLKPSWLDRLRERLSDAAEVASDLVSDGLDAALGGGAHQSIDGTQQGDETPRFTPRSSMAPDSPFAPGEVSDDPLFCSPSAVVASMPRRLSALRAEGVNVERVWSTLTCIAFLETLNCCWLWSDGDLYPAEERTIVDAGREWLEAYAKEQPGLALALEDGALAKAASRAVRQWHKAWEARVNELRRTEAITDHHSRSHTHRTAVELIRAMTTKHGTVRWLCCVPPLLRQLLTPPRAPCSLLPSCPRRWMDSSAGRCS